MNKNQLCDRCDRPLSGNYWLHVVHDDGREEKIWKGSPPLTGKFVAIYIDKNCSRSWVKKVSEEDQMMMKGNPSWLLGLPATEIHHGDRTYTLKDIVIKKKGKRFLMVMPKVEDAL